MYALLSTHLHRREFVLMCVITQFLLGLVSVTPQILLPLAGDLAPPERRGSALSIVLAGLLLGLLFGRVLAGAIAQAGTVAEVYFMSAGLQVSRSQ